MIRRVLTIALLGSAVASAGWKAGAAAVKITPKESIWMAGYDARTKPSEGVRQDIWAKALAVEDDAGVAAVLITLDLVGIRRAVAEPIAERISKENGIPRERIAFNASHTHSAPMIGDSSRYFYRMGDQAKSYADVITRYTADLSEKLASVAGQALKNRKPATLQFEQGFAGFAVNRRRVGHREYPGPVDHDVPVLAVRDVSGNLFAVLFGYACHNTVMGDYMIHGDYAGYAQHYLQEKFPGAIALFVQGAGADSNPLPRRKVEHLERYGATLADAVEEVVKGKMKPVTGTMRTAMEFVEVRFASHTKAEFEKKLQSKAEAERRHAARQLEIFESQGKFNETHPYAIQAWRFGDAFTMVLMAGELVVDYAIKLKASYGHDKTWVAGYSNDVFGYIPSLRVLREGGYEGGGAFLYGSFPGPFADDIEDRLLAGVGRVVEKTK